MQVASEEEDAAWPSGSLCCKAQGKLGPSLSSGHFNLTSASRHEQFFIITVFLKKIQLLQWSDECLHHVPWQKGPQLPWYMSCADGYRRMLKPIMFLESHTYSYFTTAVITGVYKLKLAALNHSELPLVH